MRRIGLMAAVAVAVIGAIACGSEDSTFNNGNGGDGTLDGGPGGEFSGDPLAPGGTLSACATATAGAKLQPADLVMMMDRSGSMGDTTNNPPFDPKLKWNPVTAAMKAFFTDPASSTMSASLQFFPLGQQIEGTCAYAYGTPMVALTPLTNTQPFTAAIDATKPNGATPSLPALTGAISYAKTVHQQHPDAKTVIVFITDGEPGYQVTSSGCPGGAASCFAPGCAGEHACPTNATNPYDASCDNTVPNVAAAAASALSAGIPTYVIGVGPSLDKLNAVAQAGGTTASINVPVNDPTQTNSAFQQALNQIRGESLTCAFTLPPPPSGQSLDVNAVNVVYEKSGGQNTLLVYSKDCSDANGWHYDNPAAPTKVQLCPTACSTAQSDPNGKITLAFGCTTKGDLK